MLNDCHEGACGGYLSGISIAQIFLRVGYFWSSIFKDCVNVVKRCHPFQVFARNMHSCPTPLHPIITIDPFTKWEVDFMDCKPNLAGGYHHIIVDVDYFMKWEEDMPTIKYDGDAASHYVFNHIITQFGIPKEIFTDHGCHFQNKMIAKLALKLGFKK